jgi:N-[(2S)-2-amino-2-carboxyethyl]-L-glutamate dehydrogenase
MPVLDDDFILSLEMDWSALCDRTRERLLRALREPASLPVSPAYLVPSIKTKAFQATAVSGLLLQAAAEQRWHDRIQVGICGFGLLGKLHALMLKSLFGDRPTEILVYGADPRILKAFPVAPLSPCEHWRAAYADADIFIACTSSAFPYIDALPKAGSVHLNLSLHDYLPSVIKSFGVIGVDNWNEAGIPRGDLELSGGEFGLSCGQVAHLTELIDADFWACLPHEDSVVFNPIAMNAENERQPHDSTKPN